MGGRQGGDNAGAGRLTRGAVARMLGVSVATVRRHEGATLHPVQGADGVWYFDPADVEAARGLLSPRKRPVDATPEDVGGLAAQVFPLFARGDSFADVVIATRLAPSTVRTLHGEWRLGFRQLKPSDPLQEDEGEEDVTAAERTMDERELAGWEEKMRALEREQARLDRLERRRRR
jgi:hypothetical protein